MKEQNHFKSSSKSAIPCIPDLLNSYFTDFGLQAFKANQSHQKLLWCQRSIGGDLAPRLGDGKKFRGPKIPLKDFFIKQFPFQRRKFLMTFFSDRILSDFVCFLPVFVVWNRIYNISCPFLKQNLYFTTKHSFMTTFFYSVCTFARHRPPPQILGTVPQSPLSLSPCSDQQPTLHRFMNYDTCMSMCMQVCLYIYVHV